MNKLIFIGLVVVYVLAVMLVHGGEPVTVTHLLPDKAKAVQEKAVIPPFPYKKRSEVPGLSLVSTPCEGVDRMDSNEWIIFANVTKAMYIHISKSGATDYVYLSVDQGDVISIKASLTIDAAKLKYPTPCDYFKESGV